MQLHLDTVTATIVAGVALLILVGIQTRVNRGAAEETMLYSARVQTIGFAEIVEQDLSNMGFLTVPGARVILAYSAANVAGVSYTDSLEFWGACEGGARTRIRYLTAVVDSVTTGGETVPMLQVQRFENRGLGWKRSGGSPPTLLDFDVNLLDANNTGATQTSARTVRVRFVNAVSGTDPTKSVSTLQKIRWGISLSPRGLQLQQYQG